MKFSKVGYKYLPLLLLPVLFVIDMLTPVGYDVWIFYVIPVILTSRVCSTRVVMLAAAICSGLTVIPHFLSSPSTVPLSLVIFNDTIGIAVIWTTVTILSKSKQAEEVLREAEERLRIFVEQVQEYAIILLDPEGRVVTWNIGAQRLMQYEACEIVGKSKAQFYTPEDQAAGLSDQILDLARRNGWTEKKGWRVRKDGSRFMADLVLTALHDDRGQLRGFMNVTRDITTRKNEEEHLRRQEIVQRVYEERESIARNLHDGVLQSLYAVRLGLEHCRRVVAAQPQRIVPEIDARIEDIGLVIVEIREFMTGQDLYVPRTFELRKGLAELLQVHQVSESPMWRLHVPEHDDNAGLSHEEVKHILYIAREAISNSARHAAAHLCQVALVPLEEGLRVTIEDDGVGFTPRGALQRTGRGFSNMEARARQIGVTLDIVSAPGRGTRITIDIPRRKNYVSS